MPRVSWQRGLDPKPPDQTAPFLIWQLAPPSHPCSGFSPQPFLGEPASPQPELGRGTQDLPRPTRLQASQVSKSSGRKIPMGSRVQARFPERGRTEGPWRMGHFGEGEEKEGKGLTQPRCGGHNAAPSSPGTRRRQTAEGRHLWHRSGRGGRNRHYQVIPGFRWE